MGECLLFLFAIFRAVPSCFPQCSDVNCERNNAADNRADKPRPKLWLAGYC